MFKYKKEGGLYLGVAKFESFEDRITGKHCLVFDYTEKKFTIDAYKKKY